MLCHQNVLPGLDCSSGDLVTLTAIILPISFACVFTSLHSLLWAEVQSCLIFQKSKNNTADTTYKSSLAQSGKRQTPFVMNEKDIQEFLSSLLPSQYSLWMTTSQLTDFRETPGRWQTHGAKIFLEMSTTAPSLVSL